MSRAKKGKSKNQNDLKEFMAEDMISEIETEVRPSRRPVTVIEEEDNEENEEYLNLDNVEARSKLPKENMDRFSDAVVMMINKKKINSKNAFDIPLPDVEQLTDFHQATGDNSWKKLAQTLDASSQLYSIRVDAVHYDAYKVLGGLNRTELNQEEQAQDIAGRDDEDQDTQDITIRKQRRGDGEGTLEKHLHNIDTNKYDLEFDIDPLFQKTSAKFDEGGAKGLLLNNLYLNDQLYLMFDSGNILDMSSADPQGQRRPYLTKAFLNEIKISSDVFKSNLCPELANFKHKHIKDQKDSGAEIQFGNILDEIQDEEDIEAGLRFENVNVDADQILNDLGNATEGDFHEPQALEAYHFPTETVNLPGAGVGTNENSNTQTMLDLRGEAGEIQELNFNSIEERLANLGFGQSDWMGPEAWKLKKEKLKTKDVAEKKPKRETKNKKKETIPVDFNMSNKESWKDVFGVLTTSRKRGEKKSPTKNVTDTAVKQSYLLPLDMQIKPSRLANMFSRGLFQERGGVIKDRAVAPIQEDYEFGLNNTMDNFPQDQIDQDAQEEIQQNLSSIFGAAAQKGDAQFDRPERFINIKVLKEKMWTYLSDKLPEISINDQNFDDNDEGMEEEMVIQKKKPNKKKKRAPGDVMTFTDVCKELPEALGDSNISVHSCFVTILHLANEKGLRFKKEPLDFNIFKESVA